MKKILKNLLYNFGYEIHKLNPFGPGSPQRPVGNMEYLIADLKARGLICKSVLDIGANHADWSKMVKNLYPDARFCLIEPQVELKEVIENFCNTSNQSIYYIAGADKVSDKKYLTVYDNLAGSTFLPPITDKLNEDREKRLVEMIAVDDIIESGKFDIPELVKIDVQGYELEALKGATKLFGKTEVFILEVSLFSFDDSPGMPILSEVVQFMAERDYMAYDFPGFSRRPFDGALGQCDICFVKKDGFLRASNEWG